MRKGQKHSKKTIKLIKEKIKYALEDGLMGRPIEQEVKDKIRASLLGRKHTPERVNNIRQALLKYNREKRNESKG